VCALDECTHWVYYMIEVIITDIREMRKQLGDTQSEFAARYNIPFRTIQNWEAGVRKPSEYIVGLLEHRVEEDLINRKTAVLPRHDPHKQDLPKRRDYIGATAWLRAVRERIGEPVVFALDEALMCQGSFGGRSDEYLVWVYGSDAVTRFNGVAVLGNRISAYDVEKRNGLEYTNFNRTLSDALANESILDMQGITEAVSRYYTSNGDSFSGIFVAPEYQAQFEKLANDARDYYEN
jgi:transcriptional regulator with XRE-family HTH domain